MIELHFLVLLRTADPSSEYFDNSIIKHVAMLLHAHVVIVLYRCRQVEFLCRNVVVAMLLSCRVAQSLNR